MACSENSPGANVFSAFSRYRRTNSEFAWVQLKRYHAGESTEKHLYFPVASGRDYSTQGKTILLFDNEYSDLFLDLNIIHYGRYYGYDVVFQNHLFLSPETEKLIRTTYSAIGIGSLAIPAATHLLESKNIPPTQLLLIAPDPFECEKFLEKWNHRSAPWNETKLYIFFIKENYFNSLWTESTCDFQFWEKGKKPYWDKSWFDPLFPPILSEQ